MGKKKSKGEKKVIVEEKKPEQEKKKEKAEVVEEKKLEISSDEKKDSKDEKSTPPPPPSTPTPTPPPPSEIVLSVFMHCEGCARKVRKCLHGFHGIEDVKTDCKTHKVVVKGEKADPLKVVERLQKKIQRKVELLSPIPKPPTEEVKKPEEKDPAPKTIVEKKEEPKVVTVVLKVHMHCEACSLEIKRRIERMKEVEEAIPDLKNSQVTVRGTFEPPKLVEYVYKRTGKHATVVKQDPPLEKKEDSKGKDGKKGKEKKGENSDEGKKGEEKQEPPKQEQKEEAKDDGAKEAIIEGEAPSTVEEGPKVVELTRSEFQYYPPRYAMEVNAYPPQFFSDENPNACSIM